MNTPYKRYGTKLHEINLFQVCRCTLILLRKGGPQQKGQVEVGVRHFKEAFWVNWLTLETSLGKKLSLGGLLYKEALRYVGRTRNLFATSKSHTMPMERMRRQHLPVTKTFPFGCKGFAKPPKSRPEDRGKAFDSLFVYGARTAQWWRSSCAPS